MLARLEAGADRMTLATITEALEGTGFRLFVGHDDGDEPPPAAGAAVAQLPSSHAHGHATPVSPGEWEPTDLVARVRGGGRRFPAHREVQAVDSPPLWWWIHEFFSGPTEKPEWYAPVCHLDLFATSRDDDEDSGAA
jgi:hypothetical protein